MRGYGGTMVLAAFFLTGFGMHPAQAYNEYQLLRARDLPANCAVKGVAQIKIKTRGYGGYTDEMKVQINKLAPNTRLTLFLTQVPSSPYGVSMYLGDMVTNGVGSVSRYFQSRFSKDTFVVAEGAAPAPRPHGAADAGTGPGFRPIHTYHVGLWFATPEDARKNGAGCPTASTPFNATHNAGGQLFSSRNATNSNDLTGFLSVCPGPRYCVP